MSIDLIVLATAIAGLGIGFYTGYKWTMRQVEKALIDEGKTRGKEVTFPRGIHLPPPPPKKRPAGVGLVLVDAKELLKAIADTKDER